MDTLKASKEAPKLRGLALAIGFAQDAIMVHRDNQVMQMGFAQGAPMVDKGG